ncbi:lysophospholipase L1-like esterase [Pedobacter sp. UYEF25]
MTHQNIKKYLIFCLVISLFSSFREKEISWVAIGDSITYLNDHLDETGNRVSKGYLTRVTDQLPAMHYINQGHNGWTSGGIAEHINNLALVKADVYSIFLGTNDWWAGRPVGKLEDYKTNVGNTCLFGSFRIIIDKVRALNPIAKIVLITPMQRVDFVYISDPNNNAYGSYKKKNGQSLEEFANAILAIGRYEGLPVVDLYNQPALAIKHLMKFKRLKNQKTGAYENFKFPQSTNMIFNPKTDDYPYPPNAVNVAYDGLHPSDKGNKIIAKQLVQAFKKLDISSE